MADIKLTTQFARFVAGDIKGGAAAQSFRKEIITTAIEQAFKGNYSPITEAMTLTQGKAKKARAYAAGFAALGPVGDVDGIIKVAYIGSLSAHENKAARDEIASKTLHAVTNFFVAFDAVMAEKAEPKAKAQPTAADAPAAAAAAADADADAAAAAADVARHDAAVSLDVAVSTMETNLRTGMLTGEQADRVAAAVVEALTVEQLRELADMIAARETALLMAAIVVTESDTVPA